MVTLQDIRQMVVEETQKLNKIGYFPVEVRTIKIVKAQSFFADAWRTQHMIRVSYYFLNADVRNIRATIMHELIHMVPESGHGHGFEWKSIAAKVNKAYPEYNIKRVGCNLAGGAEWSLRRAAQVSQIKEGKKYKKLIMRCTKCGCEWERTRESNFTLNPGQYHCHCGGNIIRVC